MRVSLRISPLTTLYIMSKIYSDEFLENINVLGFIIGLLNYDENLSQSDKDDMIQQFNNKAEEILEKIGKRYRRAE